MIDDRDNCTCYDIGSLVPRCPEHDVFGNVRERFERELESARVRARKTITPEARQRLYAVVRSYSKYVEHDWMIDRSAPAPEYTCKRCNKGRIARLCDAEGYGLEEPRTEYFDASGRLIFLAFGAVPPCCERDL